MLLSAGLGFVCEGHVVGAGAQSLIYFKAICYVSTVDYSLGYGGLSPEIS